VWRHVLYAVCIGEAALLPAILDAVVVEPDLLGFAPSPWVRRLCAWCALALIPGGGYSVIGCLCSLLTSRSGLNLRSAPRWRVDRCGGVLAFGQARKAGGSR
jgi:hypothetical protein